MTSGINAFKAYHSKDTCLTPQIYLTSAALTSTLRQRHQSTVLLKDTCCDSLSKTKAPPWWGWSALGTWAHSWTLWTTWHSGMQCPVGLREAHLRSDSPSTQPR